jgi:type I restriction enzyme S subunit
MNNWKETTLDKIIELVGGGTPKTSVSEYWNGNIPWLSVVDFNNDSRWVEKTEKSITEEGLENSSTKLLDSGDLVISARGTVGELAQLKRRMTFNQSCYGIKANENSDVNFLYYLLKWKIKNIKKNVHGAVFDTITRNTFEKIDILSPPLPEQKQIAAALSSLDNKIELLRKENETLEKIAQGVFKEWFVNFRIGGKKLKIKNGIPERWRVGKVGEIASLKSGFAFKGGDFVEKSNVSVLKIKDLKGRGEVDLADVSFVNDDVAKQERVKYFKLGSGDIVLAMSGNTTGKIGMIPPYLDNLFLNQRVGKFFMKDDNYKNLLYLFLMSGDYEAVILNMGYGSAQPNINPAQIENIDMIFPVDNILEKFKNAVNPMMEKVLINNSQIQTLSRLRDTLLPKLMSGKMKING